MRAGRRGPARLWRMGLTIHYRLKKDVCDLEEAARAVESLRQAALDLPFEEVGELRRFQGKECDPERWRDTELLWPLIQAAQWLDLGSGRRKGCATIQVVPVECVLFESWPGEGCEPMVVGLARYPAFVELSADFRAHVYSRTGKRYGSRVPTGGLGRGWSWRAFCKTQYASNVSVGHFLKCHSTVCALLDRAEGLGFRVDVYDEGGFWKKRDYAALAREVGVWNAHVARLLRRMEGALAEAGFKSASPITENPVYYEAAGIDSKTAKILADAAKNL